MRYQFVLRFRQIETNTTINAPNEIRFDCRYWSFVYLIENQNNTDKTRTPRDTQTKPINQIKSELSLRGSRIDRRRHWTRCCIERELWIMVAPSIHPLVLAQAVRLNLNFAGGTTS